jgi:hypothetical protein
VGRNKAANLKEKEGPQGILKFFINKSSMKEIADASSHKSIKLFHQQSSPFSPARFALVCSSPMCVKIKTDPSDSTNNNRSLLITPPLKRVLKVSQDNMESSFGYHFLFFSFLHCIAFALKGETK